MDKDLKEIWKITLAQIEVKLDSPAHFKTWFQNTTLVKIEGSKAQIGVSNSYSVDWLKKHHNDLIKDTISYICNKELIPEFIIDKELVNTPTPKVTKVEPIAETIFYGQGPSNLSLVIKKAELRETNTFENYIVGSSNKLAHAAALGVSQNPGQSYNPLFIYGGTGLGKTHLAQAVALVVLKKDPSKKILYISSEKFLNDLVRSIRSGKNAQFRQKYRSLDLLIIDDIQFIHKWKETQTEFFHTFNVLHSAQSQIILVSDRPPQEIQNLEERLRSRFQGGMIVDVGRPDYETRLAILEKKAQSINVDLSENILTIIAKNITDNVRELEGALQKINLYNSMKEGDLTEEEILNILGKDSRNKRKKLKPPKILKHVAVEFNVSVKELRGPRRTADVAFARQVCMYLLREDFEYKLEDVAKILNRKDHTTVIHAVDKIKSKLMLDEGFKSQVDMIKEKLNSMYE